MLEQSPTSTITRREEAKALKERLDMLTEEEKQELREMAASMTLRGVSSSSKKFADYRKGYFG